MNPFMNPVTNPFMNLVTNPVTNSVPNHLTNPVMNLVMNYLTNPVMNLIKLNLIKNGFYFYQMKIMYVFIASIDHCHCNLV